jgi:hypothetical protein
MVNFIGSFINHQIRKEYEAPYDKVLMDSFKKHIINVSTRSNTFSKNKLFYVNDDYTLKSSHSKNYSFIEYDISTPPQDFLDNLNNMIHLIFTMIELNILNLAPNKFTPKKFESYLNKKREYLIWEGQGSIKIKWNEDVKKILIDNKEIRSQLEKCFTFADEQIKRYNGDYEKQSYFDQDNRDYENQLYLEKKIETLTYLCQIRYDIFLFSNRNIGNIFFKKNFQEIRPLYKGANTTVKCTVFNEFEINELRNKFSKDRKEQNFISDKNKWQKDKVFYFENNNQFMNYLFNYFYCNLILLMLLCFSRH